MWTETMVDQKRQLKAVEKVETMTAAAPAVKACAMNRKAAPSSWVEEMVSKRGHIMSTLLTERKLVVLMKPSER